MNTYKISLNKTQYDVFKESIDLFNSILNGDWVSSFKHLPSVFNDINGAQVFKENGYFEKLDNMIKSAIEYLDGDISNKNKYFYEFCIKDNQSSTDKNVLFKNVDGEVTYDVFFNDYHVPFITVALENKSRLGLGQFSFIFENLDNNKFKFDYSIVDDIENIMSDFMSNFNINGTVINGKNSSLGLGNKNVPISSLIAYEMEKSIKYKYSWQIAIDKGYVENFNSPRNFEKMMGTNYDKPMNYSGLTLPIVEVVYF